MNNIVFNYRAYIENVKTFQLQLNFYIIMIKKKICKKNLPLNTKLLKIYYFLPLKVQTRSNVQPET